MGRKSRKTKRHVPRRRTQGPPPRAAFAVDAVLQRRVDRSMVNVKKLYVGPKGLDPADLVDLLSAVVAGTFTAAVKKEDQAESRKRLLEFIDSRTRSEEPARVSEIPDTHLNSAEGAEEEGVEE